MFVTLFLFLFLFTNNISAEDGSKRVLNGVKYDGVLHEVMIKEDLDKSFEIESIDIDKGLFQIKGTIFDKQNIYDIDVKGEIFRSNIQALLDSNANPFVVIPNENLDNKFEILSLSIEENAYKNLLLPANYDLEGSNVIKMAIKIQSDIYYFEDEIDNIIPFQKVATYSNTVEPSDLANKTSVEKEHVQSTLDKISLSDSWFVPFLKTDFENTEIVNDATELHKNVEVQEEGESCVNPRTTPICGITIRYFKTIGSSLVTSFSDYGFYKDTISFPTGSENRITSFMKWGYVGNGPDNISEIHESGVGSIELQVTDEGRYWYNAETGEATYHSEGSSQIRLGNAEVQVVIPKDYIILNTFKFATVQNGPSKIDFVSLLGLGPYGKNIGLIKTIYEALTYTSPGSESPYQTFYKTVDANELVFGNALRSFVNSLDEGYHLTAAGDQLGFSYTIQIPEDRERKTGWVSDKFRYSFDVYHRDFYGFWNLIDHVEKEGIDGYTVY